MTPEPGGISRRGDLLLSCMFSLVRGCRDWSDVKEQAELAGESYPPRRSIQNVLLPLSGAKDKCGNIWGSALKFRHLQKMTAPGGLAVRFGHLGKGLHGSCGGEHDPQISWHSLSIWVKVVQKKSCTWISKMLP